MGENNPNIYDRFEQHERELTSRVRGFFTRNFPYIMLVFNILFEVLTRLFSVGITFPFPTEFWSDLFLNTCSSTIAYSCFLIYADKTKRQSSPEYLRNVSLWSEKSARIRLNRFDDFLIYCKAQFEKECRERQEAIIANNTHIEIKKWREEYSRLTLKKLFKLYKAGEITFSEMYYIAKANKKPRLKPIDPLLILAGIKASNINDAGRDSSNIASSLILKPVGFISISLLVSMFAGRFIGVSDTSVLFDMLYTAGLIVGSSLAGYARGTASAERKHNEIKGRIIFIECYIKSAPQEAES